LGDLLHVRSEWIHVPVLNHLFADQAEPLTKRRSAFWIQQRLIESRAITPLKFERRTRPWRCGQAARATAPMQNALIPSQHAACGGRQRPDVLRFLHDGVVLTVPAAQLEALIQV